jgi:hypothetical protein
MSPSRPGTSGSSRIVEYEETGSNYGDFGKSSTASRPGTANSAAGSVPNASVASPKKRMVTIDHFRMDVPDDTMLRELFDHFDTDKSGAISLSEFREFFKNHIDNFGAPMEERDVDRLFARFDKGSMNGIKTRHVVGAENKGVSGDGKLHYDEFCVVMLYLLRL